MNNRVTISFLPLRDKDLIEFLKSKKDDNISEYIRQLIRKDMESKSNNATQISPELVREILQSMGVFDINQVKTADLADNFQDKEEVVDTIKDLF